MAISSRFAGITSVLAIIAVSAGVHFKAHASDHADTPAIAASPGVDLTDVFMFPSPSNPNNVVLAMNVHPLIPTGQGGTVSFDPSVLYQFKIDNVGDHKEHLVIQAKFIGDGPNQEIHITDPVAPSMHGVQSVLQPTDKVFGTINRSFTTSTGMKVFAGAREDPFFFDLNQFFTILPDRATPITGTPVANPDQPQAATFRAPGAAKDFLAGLNVLSIVVELPKSQLGTGKIGLWCTTSK